MESDQIEAKVLNSETDVMEVVESSIKDGIENTSNETPNSIVVEINDSSVVEVNDSTVIKVNDSTVVDNDDSTKREVQTSTSEEVADCAMEDVVDCVKEEVKMSTTEEASVSKIEEVKDSGVKEVESCPMEEVKQSAIEKIENSTVEQSKTAAIEEVKMSVVQETNCKIEEQEIFKPPTFASVSDFVSTGFKLLSEAIKISNSLPTQDKLLYYKSFSAFNRIMNAENEKILGLMNKVFCLMNQNVNIRSQDLDQQIETIIEANDEIFKKVSEDIDLMNGIKKTQQQVQLPEIQSVSTSITINGSWNSAALNKSAQEKSNDLVKLLAAKNTIRPQTKFRVKVDNSNSPFIPKLKEKQNSLKPLSILPEVDETGELFYPNPYEYELERFSPSTEQLQKVVPVYPKPLEDTPLIEVSTVDELKNLLEDLLKQSEVAIDLEHHSYRSFMGITCLMQISTKDTDYIIDTLELRDDLHILNEVFTKPTIIKVFHGADMDIQWLQRDMGLYVVNMFDTHQAAKLLSFARLSLAYLLEKYCDVHPNKMYQLADWRIRPLPDELTLYARMDTHYLLYIYQMLKNELLEFGNKSDNVLKSVIQLCTQICLKTYLKPIFNEDSHLQLYHESKKVFNNQQMFAFKRLFEWRDTISRDEDESDKYVLPKYQLLQISSVLPREMEGILACCNPIPPLVKSNLLELHRIILQAREQPLIKPILLDDARNLETASESIELDMGFHDLGNMEFRDDLPTLFGNKINLVKNNEVIVIKKEASKYSVFTSPERNIVEESSKADPGLNKLCPYERYKHTKSFVRSREVVTGANEVSKISPEKSTQERIEALHDHFVQVAQHTEMVSSENENQLCNNDDAQSTVLPLVTISKEVEFERISPKAHNDHLSGSRYNRLVERRSTDNVTSRGRKRSRSNDRSGPAKYNQPHGRKKARSSNSSSEFEFRKIENSDNIQVQELDRIALNHDGDVREFERNNAHHRAHINPFHNEKTIRNEIRPFDYNSVNFQKFQGGASNSGRQQMFKSKFKAKNQNKNHNKNQNKSGTYSRHK